MSSNPTILPKLSTVLSEDKIHTCTCGSHAFFSWGIKLMNTESPGLPLPRLHNMARDNEVMICAKCHKPVVMLGGDMYDASEYISSDQVKEIIMFGQSREHKAPLRAMDP